MRKLSITSILFFLVISAYAQKGYLRGKVTDAENGEALIGATISKQGTTTGSVADFDGNYSLTLDPGIHTIVYQFVSYQTKTVSNVEVKEGETTTLDIALSSDVTELEGVVITATQAKDTEVALLTVQRKAPNLVDGISSQSFRKIGDSDLSSAMKRVTGVSVQGGKYVYVRGLGDRYTKTTINEMSIPGLDPDNNSVQIDIFPTNTIENVVVYKTFSPDLLGDFSGGIVDVETKNFPEEKATSISLGIGYNPSMHFNDDFLSYKGGDMDFLGFDDGTRELPFDKNVEVPNEVSNDPRLESLTRSFDPTLAAMRDKSFMNTSFSFSHGNQIERGSATIGYNAVVNYRNNYTFYDNVEFGEYLKSSNTSVNDLQTEERRNGVLGQHDVLWSGLLSGALKFNKHSFSASILRSQNGQDQASKRTIRNFEDNPAILPEDILTYTQRSVTSGILMGKHNFEKFDIEWRNALAFSRQYEPDFRSTRIELQEDGGYSLNTGVGAGIDRFYRDLNEFNESFKVDFTIPYAEKSKLKFGAIGTLKKRDFEVLNYFFRVKGNQEITGDPNDFLSSENIWTPESGTGTYVVGNFEPSNSFDAKQNVFGGYIMTDMKITPNLRSIYGIRAEQVKMYYSGQNNLGDVVYDDELTMDELDWLPSANLVYSLSDDMNLRGSYNRTLARPSFKEKSIAQIFDPISRRTFIGNIDLEETLIDNFDIRWEYFFTANEMVSVSFFYKFFDGHIELVSFDVAPDNIKPRNSGDSEVYGAEIEFRKNINSNLSFGTNVSLVKSAVDLKSVYIDNDQTTTEYELRLANARDGEDIEETRDMAGQAPYLINTYFNYSNLNGDINANLSYNVQGESLAIVGSGRTPDIYTKPFHSLNFNIYKNLGSSQRSRLTFGVTNILADAQENVYKSHEADDKIFSIYKPERTFSLKYSYTF